MANKQWNHKALVLGRISLVRSLGREGIEVVLAREGIRAFERASRYCNDFICLPMLPAGIDEALAILERFGAEQKRKPVAFFNGESDVMLFSEHRERLGEFYEISLASHELINSLIDKGKFGSLAKKYDLPIPKTITPKSEDECIEAGNTIGYPCIIKPISQRRWHSPEIFNAIGYRKAILAKNQEELEHIMKLIPPIRGGEMVQQYIPGDDPNHYDFHAYIDRGGTLRGSIVGHKIRTYPIHFGQGCYTHYMEEPGVEETCMDTLTKIGYTGAANINVKRHAETGKDYILEINPRFSLWTIFDSLCGVNLPVQQYLDSIGEEVPILKPNGSPQRWLWFGSDFKAMKAYRKSGELTLLKWVKSFFNVPGKIEHHIFAWDDPLPLLCSWWYRYLVFTGRAFRYIKHKIKNGITKTIKFFSEIFTNFVKGRFSYVLKEIAKRCPDWLFRYNKAWLMYADNYRFPKNINPEAKVKLASIADQAEIMRISGLDKDKVVSLLESGALCFLASRGDSAPASISWNASGRCFIRGLGFEYDFGPTASYGFWAATLPEARGQGLHNAIIAAKARFFIERGADKFYSIIEFDNDLSYDIRVKAGQQPLMIIYHVKIFRIGITATKYLPTGKKSFKLESGRSSKNALVI
jgi:predicted ATP-grasp superfamily ATP-dependent carboligase